jgi:hypothetical protein
MTSKEIQIVAAIVATADGNCPVCAEQLLIQLYKQYPMYKKDIEAAYQKVFHDAWDAEKARRDMEGVDL